MKYLLMQAESQQRQQCCQHLSTIFLALAMITFIFSHPVMAVDVVDGAKVFGANCAACHMGDGNMVNPAKNLKKDVLDKHEMASLVAIIMIKQMLPGTIAFG